MKRLKLSDIQAHDKKVSGYYHDVVSSGKIDGMYLILEDDVYATLKSKYNTVSTMPSVVQQAKNITQAAYGVIKGVSKGYSVWASEDVKKSRLDKCNTCPFLSNGRCSKCGCNYKAKLALSSSKCPVGKW